MWKPSKKTLLILIFICTILAATSYLFIDWNIYNKNISSAIKELRLTIVFLGIALYFVFPYVKKLKEKN